MNVEIFKLFCLKKCNKYRYTQTQEQQTPKHASFHGDMFGWRKYSNQKLFKVQKKREISNKNQQDHSRISSKSRYPSKWCCEIPFSKSSFLIWKNLPLTFTCPVSPLANMLWGKSCFLWSFVGYYKLFKCGRDRPRLLL